MGKGKRSKHMTARLRVELETITKNMIHGLVEGHENASDKLAVVKDLHVRGSGDGGRRPLKRN